MGHVDEKSSDRDHLADAPTGSPSVAGPLWDGLVLLWRHHDSECLAESCVCVCWQLV